MDSDVKLMLFELNFFSNPVTQSKEIWREEQCSFPFVFYELLIFSRESLDDKQR